jgi:hypothetical protein
MKSKTVLFIEWSNIGRDLEMHLPVMYFFEKILNWEVQYKIPLLKKYAHIYGNWNNKIFKQEKISIIYLLMNFIVIIRI